MLVFGSCVARDSIEFADAESVDLRGYVARQSLISAGDDATAHLPDSLGITSKFQERMIRNDFAGNLLVRLESMADEIDVLLWDLADERHGVHRFPDGRVVTRSIDTIRAASVSEVLEAAEHIPFGSDEHFELWKQHVDAFDERLRALGLFDRTVVLEVPWALRTTEGKTTPWSMGVRAGDANKHYQRYYDYLRQTGHKMVELPVEVVLADPNHKWGLAPFHYTPEVYREVLWQLREVHGVKGLLAADGPDAGDEPTDA
ncbi:DUF6270 domain-containing protein [Agrococcus baldri]|uniref:DUF6270 domain-containing protein n=1 Tax=Agrococcus baldri TaxID=153730 RepID=UPI00296E762E|nr:DUF6270 domain-containing protein [Agrococcus baldri]